MVNSEKRQFADGIDGDQNADGDESVDVSPSVVETPASANPSITRRLTEILLDDDDDDLLLQRSDREDGFLQWLQALDVQVMGACRADERLKPLLKLNVSTGAAEDRLLAHLNQHFQPSEVGLLAMCLCVPLVSIRVGKINKQGTIMSPTPIRGNLCLVLLPSSDLSISFNGDDGSVERLATLNSEAQSTAIEIEQISADKSGRSFLIKNTDGVVSYLWISEKSKLLGNELLRKMKDLLTRKPSLAELSGISEARLKYFVTHLRSCLAGSMVISSHASGVLSASPPSDDTVDSSEVDLPQSSFNCQNSSLFQPCTSDGSKTNLIYQGSLCPRSSAFQEGLAKTWSSVTTAGREELTQCGENYASSVDSLSFASIKSYDPTNSDSFARDSVPEVNGIHSFSMLNFMDAFGKAAELPLTGPKAQVPSTGPSHLSPQYCWCPPGVPTRQYTQGNLQLPTFSTESVSLPPLSSLLSAAMPSSLLKTKPSLNFAEVSPVDFRSLLPEPFIRLPTSQQIPTFTPLICDPIVHIPVLEVCSSGPGCLVSAGPPMPSTIPQLNKDLMDPLLPNAEVAEKSARETLHMLINSSNQSSSQLLEVWPSVLSSIDDKQNLLVTGSRGFYSGTRDVDEIPNRRSTMGLVLLSEKALGGSIARVCTSRDDRIDKNASSDSSGFDAERD